MPNSTKKAVCYICNKIDQPLEHHISYLPQVVVNVCFICHKKIHRNEIKGYCKFTRRQKLIFYKRKGCMEFREFKNQIRVPMTKEERKRFPGGSGFKWFYMRPLTEKELWLNKEMKKTKEVLE
jgi:hypothetical protein